MGTRVGATRLRRLGETILNYTLCTLPLPPPLLLSFPLPLSSPFSLSLSISSLLLFLFFLFAFVCILFYRRLPLVILSLFMDVLHPPLSQPRRRSVDVGGLSLALGSQGLGQGWVGWDESEIDTEEQQLLCVIPPLLYRSIPTYLSRPVSLNFLATCTITPTLSSMLSSDRTYV